MSTIITWRTSTTDRALSPTIYSVSSASSFSSEEHEDEMSDKSDRPSVASREPSSVGTQKHEKYYFEGTGNVQLIIDDVLYNVPPLLLTRHSNCFRERFTQPADCLPPGWITHTTARGEQLFVNHSLGLIQDECPSAASAPDVFHLYGASTEEFDALLSVLCSTENCIDELDLSKGQWTAVLKLATLWGFTSVLALANERLNSLISSEPLEQLIYARLHGLEDLAIDAIANLVERDQWLEDDECSRLSLADVVRIARGREEELCTILDGLFEDFEKTMRMDMERFKALKEASIVLCGEENVNGEPEGLFCTQEDIDKRKAWVERTTKAEEIDDTADPSEAFLVHDEQEDIVKAESGRLAKGTGGGCAAMDGRDQS
ncbi:hypothetical protein PENSPDRAFT_686081 [Peniophora sp. CONT]|nr:hypothetical protein PENSPDRAFT_686081 [Peniophora sp. CONT]